MAAPPFVPTDPVDRPRSYESPDHIPSRWVAARPAELSGRQPRGDQLGYQGPDQGYALVLAERIGERLHVQHSERLDDALRGCLGIALRRASLYGRAPVIHDLTIACTIWGWLDPSPPDELLTLRREMFAGVANVVHHYAEARAIADMVPESTLRMQPAAVTEAYSARWRELLGR
jgi:hypothetical protein